MTTGAVLLAGGRARRVDGAAKHLFEVGGRTLLERAVTAVADCSPVIVAGDPVADVTGVAWVREQPRHAGPAAAVVAALAWATARWDAASAELPEWMFVLACDLPGVEAAAARLQAARPLLPRDTDGVCLADTSSRPQWLTGLYRTEALRRSVTAMPDGGRDAAVRDLFADLAIAAIAAPEAETDDVDTWDDLERARARAEEDT